MADYTFIQDVKVTIWARQKFNVEAESYEEALKEVEQFKTEDVGTARADLDPDVDWLFDTWEPITPEENDGCATIELYDCNKECKLETDSFGRYPLLGKNGK